MNINTLLLINIQNALNLPIMDFNIYYKKNKNKDLFNQMQDADNLDITSPQNYIPIYNNFFSLNDNNYNSINLNHKFYLESLAEKKTNHIFSGSLVRYCDDTIEKKENQDIFFKFSPLLDPLKYMVGKYNSDKYDIFALPCKNREKEEKIEKEGKIEKKEKEKKQDKDIEETKEDNVIHPKVNDPNNSAYVDGFFSYLTSQLLNNHGFVNGLDYYGSFLGVKNNFSVNVIDDLEYLAESDFFNQNNGKLYTISDVFNDEVINSISRNYKKRLEVSSEKSALSIDSLHSFIMNSNEVFETEKSEEKQKKNQKKILYLQPNYKFMKT